MITQINYPNLNKQDSTEQVRGLYVKWFKVEGLRLSKLC